jgi:hypothetical protein
MDPGYRYGRDQDHEHGDPGDYCDHLFIHTSPLRESACGQTAAGHRCTLAVAEARVLPNALVCNQPRSGPGVPLRRGFALWGCLPLTQRSPLVSPMA